ncbi:MAG: alpha/beta fold hydrolase [Deltaproteobacteria bacterium]|nr:alpha/beta fold hydrolase [Deltaproteobacteria bacterium]
MRHGFKSFLLLCAVIFISSCGNSAPETVGTHFLDAESLATLSTADLADFSDLAQVEYGVSLNTGHAIQIYKIQYQTKDPFGNDTLASGALFIPQSSNPLPLLSIQHGTEFLRKNVASQTGFDAFGILAASEGYLTLVPDYLGLGDSTLLHPYHHETSTANAVIDMIRAVQEFAAAQKLALNGQLFLAGYSEGGYATMATTKALEKTPISNLTLTASAPLAGAYALEATAIHILKAKTYPYPAFLAYLLAAYHQIYADISLEDSLLSPYPQELPNFIDGTHDGDSINEQLSTDLTLVLKSDYRADFLQNPQHPLRMRLRENQVYEFKPMAPMLLVHCKQDTVVPFLNARIAMEHFAIEGSTAVELEAIPTGDHSECAIPAILKVKVWFAALLQPGSA